MKNRRNNKREISNHFYIIIRLEEGKKIRDKMINEKKLLESIKDNKLKSL